MIDHYGLTEKQWDWLQKQGTTVADLFHGVSEFCAQEAPLSKISLLHYADRHGDFLETMKPSKLDFVAQKVFENMSIPDQIEIGSYLEYLENGDDEEDEEVGGMQW